MRTLSLMTALVLVVACGGDDAAIDARPPADTAIPADAFIPPGPDGGTSLIPEDLPSPLPTGAADLTVVTYNAGLIAVVMGAAERLPLIQTAVKALPADVVCMQEIYTGFTKPHLFAAAMADTFPYSYWTWTGVAASGNGLMILSKHPLYRGREIQFAQGTTTTVDRMAIGATVVDSDDAWHVNVLCTHLHAGLDPVDDFPIKGSEIDEIETWADAQWPDGPTLLLGDFNCGPMPPSADPCDCDTNGGSCETVDHCDAPDMTNYNKLLETWTDVFAADDDFFTSGHDQFIDMSLVPGLYPNEPSQRIDHCFYRDFTQEEFKAGELVLTEAQSIDIVVNEVDITLEYLSDHYGVQCTFGPTS